MWERRVRGRGWNRVKHKGGVRVRARVRIRIRVSAKVTILTSDASALLGHAHKQRETLCPPPHTHTPFSPTQPPNHPPSDQDIHPVTDSTEPPLSHPSKNNK